MKLTEIDYKRGAIVRDFITKHPNRSKADITKVLSAATRSGRMINPTAVSFAIRAARQLLFEDGATTRLIVDRVNFTYRITDDAPAIRRHVTSNQTYADTRATTEYWNSATHPSDTRGFTAHRNTVVKLHKQLTRKAA